MDSKGSDLVKLDVKSASTWQVPFASGKFGKPIKLFDGSFHGGISEDESLAKDYSKRTAFLDFGGGTGKSFVGKKYGVHEYLLVADSSYKCRLRSHENCPCPLGG